MEVVVKRELVEEREHRQPNMMHMRGGNAGGRRGGAEGDQEGPDQDFFS